MTRRKSVLGLLCLSALCLCAFGASTASASTLHECVKEGTATTYTSATCATAGVGEFKTKPISTVAIGIKATGTSNFVLSATIGGIVTTITCTGLESSGATAKNEESGGEMFASGSGITKFTGCAVTAPAGKGCTVPATLETVNLNSKSTVGEKMGVKYTPAAGEKFITITIGGPATCPAAIKGEKEVKGSATSETKTSSTQAFTGTSGSELTFGGQKATFTGEYHFSKTDGTALGLETP